MTNEFIPGQRWISDTELQMGLGTVLAVEHRTVTILFHATGETRIYAKQSAPLTRVKFAAGDNIRSSEGWELHVTDVEEHEGILVYIGERDEKPAVLDETRLDNFIRLNRPADRLFTAQIDKNKWFHLRYQTLIYQNILGHSELYGLAGGRTSLIPHQLYIAHEVANRFAPRVLLADEVGLGKTIEAGLILHHQLVTERAQRVLIVVPETLLHQWLVEMLRRFNLQFSIFDADRVSAIMESNNNENPFHSEQLVLCSINFLSSHPEQHSNIIDGNWDLLIVDEAHHLQWSETQASPEYSIIEQLAKVTPGVLLLTATPEQLGKAGHFARLRLLDPDRFPEFSSFIDEEKSYEPVAQAIEQLLEKVPLDEQAQLTLESTLNEGDNKIYLQTTLDEQADDNKKSYARQQLINHLLDRHGTGRVLFRNTRQAIKGFPERKLNAYPLPLPDQYLQCIEQAQSTSIDTKAVLTPERLYSEQKSQTDWTSIDPRVDWLRIQLKSLKPEKILVIAAHAETILELAETLRVKHGIHAAVFHEGLSIIERDRAAAYFADPDYGSQVLLCSEIGSEGRNFQFAHHLILFDLPLNPDLLEQRIGRLDRIGQRNTIQIHVPYLQGTAQEVLFNWYQSGLNAFEDICPAGQAVFQKVETELTDALHHIREGLDDLSTLISATQKLYNDFNDQLHRGRDRLLEYNSCRPDIANNLQHALLEQDRHTDIKDYLENIFDCFGIESEAHSADNLVIRPGNHMQVHSFPGLLQDGMTITYDRDTALTHEDMHFITWEHPLTAGAMDMVLSNETGNSSFTTIKYKSVNPGTILLECLFVLDTPRSHNLQTQRYLPPTMIRTLLDTTGNDHADSLSHEAIQESHQPVANDVAKNIIRSHTPLLRQMLEESTKHAQAKAPGELEEAHQHTRQTLETEINRLKALKQVNSNIRDEEIDFFQHQWDLLNEILDNANIRLDAIRIAVAI
ncbi:MAG: RNA polymerase-associated protein RapA [Gammaproteobacteria bacterium]